MGSCIITRRGSGEKFHMDTSRVLRNDTSYVYSIDPYIAPENCWVTFTYAWHVSDCWLNDDTSYKFTVGKQYAPTFLRKGDKFNFTSKSEFHYQMEVFGCKL